MKKPHSVSDFSEQRTRVLMQDFHEALFADSQHTLNKAFSDAAAGKGAPRFWVSETRALTVVRRMLGGEDPTAGMYGGKREMYREIFRRVTAEIEKRPGEPLVSIVFDVVNSPAPSHYISPSRLRTIVYEEKKRRREKTAGRREI